MAAVIVQSTEIVTLVGGGRVNKAVLADSVARAPVVVAADGGAAEVLALGVIPDAVIGDLDSLTSEASAQIPADRVHKAEDQNLTDFEKALDLINAPLILAVGFTGRRLDHELAAYNALVRHQACPLIIIGEEDICFHLTSKLTLDLPAGTRLSLFPMAEVTCATAGLRWPTDHLTFSPWGRVGTSNEVATAPTTLEPSGPGMMVVLPLTHLGAAITALTSP